MIEELWANEFFWVAMLVVAGYLIRLGQDLLMDMIHQFLYDRWQRQARVDAAEIARIEEGLPMSETLVAMRRIEPSPVPRRAPVPDWERVAIAAGPKHASSEEPEPTKISFFQRWAAETRPRTAEQVATEAYEHIKEEAGVAYQGRHRADSFTSEQLKLVMTPTSEWPALRRLDPTWVYQDAPQVKEVFA